jgi:arsenate reductase
MRIVMQVDASIDTSAAAHYAACMARFEILHNMRTGEAIYRELDLAHVTDRERLIAALIAHPILLERPIVICDDARAVIGRPPERVDELLAPAR